MESPHIYICPPYNKAIFSNGKGHPTGRDVSWIWPQSDPVRLELWLVNRIFPSGRTIR